MQRLRRRRTGYVGSGRSPCCSRLWARRYAREAERASSVCPAQPVAAGSKPARTSSSGLGVEHYRCGEQDQNFVHLLEGAHDIAGLAANLPQAHPCDRGRCED